MAKPRLILASSSPRRRQLMAEAGYEFEVIAPDESAEAECGICSKEGPAGLVAELAYRKGADVVRKIGGDDVHDGPIVIAADTVAECDGMILGKPADEAEARAMLGRLAGRPHRVLTGVCVWNLSTKRAPLIRVDVTKLRMDRLSGSQLDAYIASGKWEGKAGAFGYQDRLGWVHVEQGSETNVVGLPMEMLAQMLRECEGSPCSALHRG